MSPESAPFAPEILPAELENAREVIARALKEDIGSGDITTELLVSAEATGVMRLTAREALRCAGLPFLPLVFGALGGVEIVPLASDGAHIPAGGTLAELRGPGSRLLTGERVALNLLQRLSGIATETARYVEAVRGTGALILDTRKTAPGLRMLDKYAVRAGGGHNHRLGLYDAVMIKDNHIALCGGVSPAIQRAREGLAARKRDIPLIVECDTMPQVEEALACGATRLLLDNMSPAMLKEAVALAGGRAKLEASGGVTLETVREIAASGVDFISVGALTHSVRACDIGADMTLSA